MLPPDNDNDDDKYLMMSTQNEFRNYLLLSQPRFLSNDKHSGHTKTAKQGYKVKRFRALNCGILTSRHCNTVILPLQYPQIKAFKPYYEGDTSSLNKPIVYVRAESN
jgi:hypothetical protein